MTTENGASSNAAPTAEVAPINPHVLWRKVLGLVFWTGVIPFLVGGLLGSITRKPLLAGL